MKTAKLWMTLGLATVTFFCTSCTEDSTPASPTEFVSLYRMWTSSAGSDFIMFVPGDTLYFMLYSACRDMIEVDGKVYIGETPVVGFYRVDSTFINPEYGNVEDSTTALDYRSILSEDRQTIICTIPDIPEESLDKKWIQHTWELNLEPITGNRHSFYWGSFYFKTE